MLFDPKWNQPSIAGFKAWLERQPKDKTFNYNSCNTCAVAQYLESLGKTWFDFENSTLLAKLNMFASDAACRANNWRPTFGDVLDEINCCGKNHELRRVWAFGI